MKKLTAISITVVFIVLSVFSCATNQSENDASSNTSFNILNSSSYISLGFSDNSINASSDAPFVSCESSASELSSPAESTPDTFVPEESDVESSDESKNENSSDNESEDISDTSSGIPSEPTHTCSFVKGKTTAPTCTEKGYTLYSCLCGKSEKRDYVTALGHSKSDWITVTEATTDKDGLKQKLCIRCKIVLEEAVIEKIESSGSCAYFCEELYPDEKYPHAFCGLYSDEELHLHIAERVLYYINIYREQDGVAPATALLNGKTYLYATMRAEQLSTNFAHDTEDIRKVCTELEFGYYHPTVEYFYDDEGNLINVIERDEAYYSGGCSEAITMGHPFGSIDGLARSVAEALYNSSAHWSYVGAETTKHITVGFYYEYKTYFCIATSSSDKYD